MADRQPDGQEPPSDADEAVEPPRLKTQQRKQSKRIRALHTAVAKFNLAFPGCNILLGVQSMYGWGKWHWVNAGPQLRLPSAAETCFDFVESTVAEQENARKRQHRSKTVEEQLAEANLGPCRTFLTAMEQEGVISELQLKHMFKELKEFNDDGDDEGGSLSFRAGSSVLWWVHQRYATQQCGGLGEQQNSRHTAVKGQTTCNQYGQQGRVAK